MVGDDGQGLERGAGKPANDLALDLHEAREVGGRAKGPAPACLNQVNAAVGVKPREFLHQAIEIGAFGQVTGELVAAEGFAGREEDRLEEAQLLKPFAHVVVPRELR
jgi:hypothetical protein